MIRPWLWFGRDWPPISSFFHDVVVIIGHCLSMKCCGFSRGGEGGGVAFSLKDVICGYDWHTFRRAAWTDVVYGFSSLTTLQCSRCPPPSNYGERRKIFAAPSSSVTALQVRDYLQRVSLVEHRRGRLNDTFSFSYGHCLSSHWDEIVASRVVFGSQVKIESSLWQSSKNGE